MYAPIAMNATWPKLSSPVKPNCTWSAEREDRVDARDHADEGPELAARERRHSGARPPEEPLRPDEQDARSGRTNATTGLYTGSTPAAKRLPGRELLDDAQQQPAEERAVRAADPAEHDRREDRQQERKPMFGVNDACNEPLEHAGEAGQGARERAR